MRLETERLIVRSWKDEDRAPFTEVISDPVVRRFFPEVGTRADADAGIDRAIARLAEHGMTFQAVERKADGVFIGMTGLAPIREPIRSVIPSGPEIEIGWQLGKAFWGQGYAPEAARACLQFAWDVLNAREIVAFTAVVNLPSRRVMEKIGMVRSTADDFDHPEVPEGHLLRPHVLYRIANPTLSL